MTYEEAQQHRERVDEAKEKAIDKAVLDIFTQHPQEAKEWEEQLGLIKIKYTAHSEFSATPYFKKVKSFIRNEFIPKRELLEGRICLTCSGSKEKNDSDMCSKCLENE